MKRERSARGSMLVLLLVMISPCLPIIIPAVVVSMLADDETSDPVSQDDSVLAVNEALAAEKVVKDQQVKKYLPPARTMPIGRAKVSDVPAIIPPVQLAEALADLPGEETLSAQAPALEPPAEIREGFQISLDWAGHSEMKLVKQFQLALGFRFVNDSGDQIVVRYLLETSLQADDQYPLNYGMPVISVNYIADAERMRDELDICGFSVAQPVWLLPADLQTSITKQIHQMAQDADLPLQELNGAHGNYAMASREITIREIY